MSLALKYIWRKKMESMVDESTLNLTVILHGNCYKNGWGVTKDVNQAREWYTKAAAQGYANAQTALDRLNASNN